MILMFAITASSFSSCKKKEPSYYEDTRQPTPDDDENKDDQNKDDDDENKDDETPDYSEYQTQSGIYIGVTGFNSDLTHYSEQFTMLTNNNLADVKTFIDGLSSSSGTILYYSMENALQHLKTTKFPDDLQNVSIVTFTDGLDQGSSAKNPNFQSAAAYLDSLHNEIVSIKINNRSINAYSIGLKGTDIADDAQFIANLKGFASNDNNVKTPDNIDEARREFMAIADSLYKENTSYSLKLSIPRPYNNTKIRFTFDADITNADSSKCYIEGIFNNMALTGITYEGITSDCGNSLNSIAGSGIDIEFTFPNIKTGNESTISSSNIKQWTWIEKDQKWQINSEFNPDQSSQTTTEQKSAVIILLLDCSSSLGSDFSKVKDAAKDFVDALIPSTKIRFYKAYYSYSPYVDYMRLCNRQGSPLATQRYSSYGSGYSSYVEIPSGTHIPQYQTSNSSNWYNCIENAPNTYQFRSGKSYTIKCTNPSGYNPQFEIIEES